MTSPYAMRLRLLLCAGKQASSILRLALVSRVGVQVDGTLGSTPPAALFPLWLGCVVVFISSPSSLSVSGVALASTPAQDTDRERESARICLLGQLLYPAARLQPRAGCVRLVWTPACTRSGWHCITAHRVPPLPVPRVCARSCPDRTRPNQTEVDSSTWAIVNCQLSSVNASGASHLSGPPHSVPTSVVLHPACVCLSVTDSLACHCPPPCRIPYCTNTVVACCPLPAAPCLLSLRALHLHPFSLPSLVLGGHPLSSPAGTDANDARLTQSALVHVPLLEQRQQPEQLLIHHRSRPRDLVAYERALVNKTFLPSLSSRTQSEIEYA